MLVDIPLEKILKLCTILEKEMPSTMFAVNTMKRCHEYWKEKGEKCPMISLLYSKDNEESGVVVIIYTPGYLHGPFIGVYALDAYENTLKTELLNWNFLWTNDRFIFCHVYAKHVSLLDEILAAKNYIKTKSFGVKCFTMPIEKALKLDTECSDTVEFGPLSANHLNEIYDSWFMKGENTINDLRCWYELDKKYAVGIFHKSTGNLLSSVMRKTTSSLSIIESTKGRDYAVLLMKKVCKMLAQDSLEPCTTASEMNEAILKIIESVGFEHSLSNSAFYCEKKSS